jgi:hypothetical protein
MRGGGATIAVDADHAEAASAQEAAVVRERVEASIKHCLAGLCSWSGQRAHTEGCLSGG